MFFIKKIAIYHCTEATEEWAIVYEKTMQELRNYASIFGVIEKEYLDKTLLLCKQFEKQKMFEEIGNYDVLVIWSFNQMAQNVNVILSQIMDIQSKGVAIYSVKDGYFHFDNAPFEQKLKVALYHSICHNKTKYGRKIEPPISMQTQIDIFNLFVKSKTNWEVVNIYKDETEWQSDKTQIGMKEMLNNHEKYDLVICQKLCGIHQKTSKFLKRLKAMECDIYSLKEGYLKIEREGYVCRD